MKNKLAIASLLSAALLMSGASAEEMGVAVGVGTTGASFDYGYALQKDLGLRVGLNYLNYSTTVDTSDVNYDLKLKLQSVNFMIDWFPSDSGFHVSAALVQNGNKFTTSAKPKANLTYTVNGNTYNSTQAGKIDGDISFRSAAPYLGIGWGKITAGKGWGFSSDLGVLFQGSPSSTLTNSGCTIGVVAGVDQCAKLATDIAAERVKLDDKLNNFRYYPVLRVAASYAF